MFNKVTGARNKEYKMEYQTMLGTQLLDKRGDVESLVASMASAESDEQVAYLRDFFSYSLHGAGEAFKHADKNIAYLMQLVGRSRYYIKPALFSQGYGTTNKGRQEANRIITGYVAAELERIKKVIKSNNGELTSGEKASDIILYTTEAVKENGLIKEVKYVTLADVGAEFTVFDDILTDSVKNELINNKDIQTVEDFEKALNNDKALEQRIHADLNAFFGKLVKEDRDQLESFSFLNQGDNRNLALSTIKNRSFNESNLSDDQIFDASLLHFTYASFIHKFEMTTLFYADSVYFNHDKDEHMKRIPTFFATGRIPVADESNEQWLQNNPGGYYNSEFFKNSGLTQPASNQLVSRQLNSSVLEDAIESISEVSFEQMVTSYMARTGAKRKEAEFKYRGFKNMKSADAQGWISFDAYRALEWRLDNWSDIKEDMYQRILKGEDIDPETAETFFPIKKMQYAGPVGAENFAPSAVHKYSLMPLIPSVIKDTELELLHNKMVSQNIAYSVMHSGSKVASMGKDNKLNKFYTEPNGNHTLAFAAADYEFVSNPIYLHYFKEQLVTHDSAKEKVKFPTQKRALITSGLDEFGVPTDFDRFNKDGTLKDADTRLANWNALPNENERLKESQAYRLKRNYQGALKNLFDAAVQKFKMELGYKDLKSTAKDEGINLQKLMAFVQEQLSSRDALSEYQLDFLELSPSGQLVYPQDFGADPGQIEKLIASLVNKRITDQMSRGEAFIQASNVGFRKRNLRADKSLLFYRLDANGNTLPMQVKIPLIGDFKNLLQHVDNEGKKIGTIARLNELIKDEKWLETNRGMITMGGDRIPIQGHNSMEVMEIAEFLDPSGGNMMVLPLEIVAKTGGDFDIDKLVCLIPVIKNNMGQVELSRPEETRKMLKTIVKEKEALQNQLDEVRKIKIKLSDEERANVQQYKEDQRLAQEEFNQNHINDYYVGGSLDKYLNKLDNAQKAIDSVYENAYSEKNSEIESIKNKLRKLNRQQDSYNPAAYQNALMESMNDILLRGDNFSVLTLPNDTDRYTRKNGPVDTFTEVNRPFNRGQHKTDSKKTKMSPTMIMTNRYNNQKAFALSAGKSGVSIDAKSNKVFVQYKEVGMYMEPVYTAVKGQNSFDIKQRLLVKSNILEVDGNRVISLGHANDVNGEDISDQISQLLNGDLDVAKEDWVSDINAIKEIKSEYIFLLEAGAGEMMTSAFLSQPLIKKYVEAIRKNNNLFALAAKSEDSSLSFAKYEALLEMLNEYMPSIFSYATAPINRKTGEMMRPSTPSLVAAVQEYLGDPKNFELNDLIANSKKGSGQITEYDRQVFAHFIEIIDLTKGDTELKRTISIDTNKQLSAVDAYEKINNLKSLSGRFPTSKITQLIKDTYLVNFRTQNLLLEAISKVLPLRGSKAVQEYLYALAKDKNFEDQRTRENYKKNWIADLTSYISANGRPRVTSADTTYRGLELEDAVEIKNQTLLPFGAVVYNATLLVDQAQIDIDFYNRNYMKSGYGEDLLAKFPSTVFDNYKPKTALNLYRAFVYEREIARALIPFEEVEQHPEFVIYRTMRMNGPGAEKLGLVELYEEFIRNKGLYNSGLDAGKFESVPSFGIYSMYDTMTTILEQASLQGINLKDNYKVLDAFKKVEIGNKHFIALRKKVKDVDDQTAFTSELINLMNPAVPKHPNEDFNYAISAFFAKFPEMAFTQAGNNSGSGLYLGSIIDPKQMAVAEHTNLIDFIGKLSDPDSAKAILDDYSMKFEMKAPYAKKASYFNYNSDTLINEYGTKDEATKAMSLNTLSITTSEVKKEPHWKKDEAMANASTKAIAKATTPKTSTYKSSTKAYLAAIGGASTDFTSSDSVWVFGAGAWSATSENIKADFDNYYRPTIDKALASGVTTFNVGIASGIDTLATDYLKSKGFNVESQGEWNKLTVTESQVEGPGPETRINVYSSDKNGYEDLSNFEVRPFKINIKRESIGEMSFQSVEQAYQWMKGLYTNNYEIDPSVENASEIIAAANAKDKEIQDKILATTNGATLRQLGRSFKNFDSSDWDPASSATMRSLLRESFKANPEALTKLLSTGNATLTHTQDKSNWATEFPKLLMAVRNELRSNQVAINNIARTPKTLKGKMSFDYGKNKRPDIKVDTTFDAILNGQRTATTRYESDDNLDYWKEAKVGDIITWKGPAGKTIDVIVTKALHPLKGSGKNPEIWSKLEGWSVDYFNSKVKPKMDEAWQLEFQLPNANASFITTVRGPKELVNYEDGSLIPVAKVYKQTQFMKPGETFYDLTQTQAQVIMNNNPNKIFVFDWMRPDPEGNDDTRVKDYSRQAWRVGLTTGQSFGITTKTFKGFTPTDEQFKNVKEIIDDQMQQLIGMRESGREVVFPSDGIGQNLREAGADQIFVYLSKKLLENFGYRNPVFDKISLVLGPGEVTGMDYMQAFYKELNDAESGEKAQTATSREVREHIKHCKKIE
jgi:predicted NAD-dependent protein-ADP-ribosyltransferase YbiA (DUF1768 family)